MCPFTFTAKVLKINVAIKDEFMFLISVSKMAKLAFFVNQNILEFMPMFQMYYDLVIGWLVVLGLTAL